MSVEKNFIRGERYALDAVKAHQSMRKPPIIDLAHDYFVLGDIRMARGNYDGALNSYHKSKENFERMYGDNHHLTAATLSGAAEALVMLGQYETALEYYKKIESVCLDTLGSENEQTLTVAQSIKVIKEIMERTTE